MDVLAALHVSRLLSYVTHITALVGNDTCCTVMSICVQLEAFSKYLISLEMLCESSESVL